MYYLTLVTTPTTLIPDPAYLSVRPACLLVDPDCALPAILFGPLLILLLQSHTLQYLFYFRLGLICKHIQLLVFYRVLFIRNPHLANRYLVVLHDVVFSNVNLFHSQVLVDLLRVAQVLGVSDHLRLEK